MSISIKASRWPWQNGYSWRGIKNSAAPLNPGNARFGGGWHYRLGIDCGKLGRSGTINFYLLFGMVSFSWDYPSKATIAEREQRERAFQQWKEGYAREKEIKGRIQAARREALGEKDPKEYMVKFAGSLNAEYGEGTYQTYEWMVA